MRVYFCATHTSTVYTVHCTLYTVHCTVARFSNCFSSLHIKVPFRRNNSF